MGAKPSASSAARRVDIPRPGHADLVGKLKYGFDDMRDVLERASARETAMRVALGAAARRFLHECGVVVASRVVAIGGESDDSPVPCCGVERPDRRRPGALRRSRFFAPDGHAHRRG